MIKLQVPTGGTGVSFDGKNYTADKKGIVEVPVEAANDLIQYHGFKIVIEKEKTPLLKIKEETITKIDELDELDELSELDEVKESVKSNKKN